MLETEQITKPCYLQSLQPLWEEVFKSGLVGNIAQHVRHPEHMPRLLTWLDSKTVMLGWVGPLGLLGQLWWIPGNLGLLRWVG